MLVLWLSAWLWTRPVSVWFILVLVFAQYGSGLGTLDQSCKFSSGFYALYCQHFEYWNIPWMIKQKEGLSELMFNFQLFDLQSPVICVIGDHIKLSGYHWWCIVYRGNERSGNRPAIFLQPPSVHLNDDLKAAGGGAVRGAGRSSAWEPENSENQRQAGLSKGGDTGSYMCGLQNKISNSMIPQLVGSQISLFMIFNH